MFQQLKGLTPWWNRRRQRRATAGACFETETDLYGSDIVTAPANSAEQCQAQCQATPGCAFFTFSNRCMLKTSDKDKRRIGSAVSGPRICSNGYNAPIYSGGATGAGCFEAGTDYYGGDLATASASSAEQCQAQCQATPGCSFFTFSGRCLLKTSDKDKRRTGSAVSGPRVCSSVRRSTPAAVPAAAPAAAPAESLLPPCTSNSWEQQLMDGYMHSLWDAIKTNPCVQCGKCLALWHTTSQRPSEIGVLHALVFGGRAAPV